MFTFKLYKGEVVITPPNRIPDINAAVLMAGHFIKDYRKVEVIFNGNVVVKTLENDNPVISTSF